MDAAAMHQPTLQRRTPPAMQLRSQPPEYHAAACPAMHSRQAALHHDQPDCRGCRRLGHSPAAWHVTPSALGHGPLVPLLVLLLLSFLTGQTAAAVNFTICLAAPRTAPAITPATADCAALTSTLQLLPGFNAPLWSQASSCSPQLPPGFPTAPPSASTLFFLCLSTDRFATYASQAMSTWSISTQPSFSAFSTSFASLYSTSGAGGGAATVSLWVGYSDTNVPRLPASMVAAFAGGQVWAEVYGRLDFLSPPPPLFLALVPPPTPPPPSPPPPPPPRLGTTAAHRPPAPPNPQPPRPYPPSPPPPPPMLPNWPDEPPTPPSPSPPLPALSPSPPPLPPQPMSALGTSEPTATTTYSICLAAPRSDPGFDPNPSCTQLLSALTTLPAFNPAAWSPAGCYGALPPTVSQAPASASTLYFLCTSTTRYSTYASQASAVWSIAYLPSDSPFMTAFAGLYFGTSVAASAVQLWVYLSNTQLPHMPLEITAAFAGGTVWAEAYGRLYFTSPPPPDVHLNVSPPSPAVPPLPPPLPPGSRLPPLPPAPPPRPPPSPPGVPRPPPYPPLAPDFPTWPMLPPWPPPHPPSYRPPPTPPLPPLPQPQPAPSYSPMPLRQPTQPPAPAPPLGGCSPRLVPQPGTDLSYWITCLGCFQAASFPGTTLESDVHDTSEEQSLERCSQLALPTLHLAIGSNSILNPRSNSNSNSNSRGTSYGQGLLYASAGLFALRRAFDCYAGFDLTQATDRGTSTACIAPCAGNPQQTCGGQDAYLLWARAPGYGMPWEGVPLGCFKVQEGSSATGATGATGATPGATPGATGATGAAPGATAATGQQQSLAGDAGDADSGVSTGGAVTAETAGTTSMSYLALGSGTMTPLYCFGLTRQLGFRFYALRNGTDCLGGNSLEAAVAGGAPLDPLHACGVPCAGDAAELCGGAAALSLYDTMGLPGPPVPLQML